MSALGAHLDHPELLSPQPERLVEFYDGVMGMRSERIGRNRWACTAPERRLLIARGPPPSLGFGAYRLDSVPALAAMRERLDRRGLVLGALDRLNVLLTPLEIRICLFTKHEVFVNMDLQAFGGENNDQEHSSRRDICQTTDGIQDFHPEAITTRPWCRYRR